MKDSKSSIPLSVVQEVLESAKNAADKGVSEYSTPMSLAKILRIPLPKFIETVCDLTAGRGQLAGGVADETTTHLLLCEIQRTTNVKIENRPVYLSLDWSRITGDVTKVYSLLRSVDWKTDLFVLNPPFSLHFYKENLADLAHSELADVRSAFAVDDPQVGRKQIDSTIATLLIALDRSSSRGEGFLIGNNSTLERLIFKDGAIYGMLKKYVWLRAVLNGNPMTGRDGDNWNEGFQTGIIYFAQSHESGPQMDLSNIHNTEELAAKLKTASEIRHRLRNGPCIIYANSGHRGSASAWAACKTEWDAQQRKDRSDWNIFLDGDIIKTSLSRYDEALENISVNKKDAAALFRMNGANPMSLVLQSETRAALVRATRGDIWRVQPELTAEVDRCISEYSAARAPLYALSDVQRLGYCDEEKFIRCKKELRSKKDCLLWAPGLTYEMRTKTVTVERTTEKPNLAGTMETILLSGAELIIEIKGEDGEFHSFLDARHSRPGVTVTLVGSYSELKAEFNLQDLLETFTIPEVNDVSITSRETYESNKAMLGKIQAFVDEFINA
jgi:predicted RNA methylase